MLRHICRQNLNAGKLLLSSNAHTSNSENSIWCKERKILGYVLFKNNYCDRPKLPVRNTVEDIKKVIQEELDELLKNPAKKRLYQTIQHTLEVYRYAGKNVPSEISPRSMIMLLNQNERGRRKFFEVLYKREQRNKAIAEQKLLEPSKMDEEFVKWGGYDGEQLSYGLHRNAMFLRIYKKARHTFFTYKLMYAIQFDQPVVFDLDYEQHMTYREMAACAKQITLTFANNRLHRLPFHMYLCGADPNSTVMKHLYHHMPTMYDKSYPMTNNPKSYMELFDKSKLVYLTPHTNTVLTNFDPDAIYIIGGIVDKGESIPLSLAKAKKHGIKTARFPLDEYMSWGYGNKSLTIDQVFQILLELRATNDWPHALQVVPKRKLYENVQNILNRAHQKKQMQRNEDPF